MKNLKKWIINADDFGYSKGVNYGIIEAHQQGIVTSATLMANMPGATHAAALAKDNPNLGVGVHLVLTIGKPLSEDVPSLIDENGHFLRYNELVNNAQPTDVEKEWTAQIEYCLSLGIKPTHFDSHHHVHQHPNIYPVVEKLAEKYQVPIRFVPDGKKEIQPVPFLCTDFYGDHLTVEHTITLFQQLLKQDVVEIMTHPAFIDYELMTGSSYHLERPKELMILTHPKIQEFINNNNIQLVHFGNL